VLSKPILLVGAGALGSALLKGMKIAGHVSASDLIILDLKPQAEALAYAEAGARLNPAPEVLKEAAFVILAVKPQVWRTAAEWLEPYLSPTAIVSSVMAGVRTHDLEALFAREVVRVMPTTGMATGKGVASIYSADEPAYAAAEALFVPMSVTVRLEAESQMDSATAVSGSGPAYVYAFVRALERAALAADLPADTARTLARATLISAANLLDMTGEEPDALIKKVASPAGTTEAALKVLCAEGNGLDELVAAAVQAAVKRSIELG
jgi:pyrroline-5-carboxylate reductase